MKELQKQLDMLIRKSGADMQVIEMIRNEPSAFPFSTPPSSTVSIPAYL